LLKRQITDREFGAASHAALHAGRIDRRAGKRVALKALRKLKHEALETTEILPIDQVLEPSSFVRGLSGNPKLL
jgi:hypothetical protein